MMNAMNNLGFISKAVRGSIFDLEDNMFPCVAHVIINNNLGHFIVIHKIDRKKKILTIADPAVGRRLMSYTEFLEITTNQFILFTPTKTIPFYEEQSNIKKSIISLILKYKATFLIIFCVSLLCVLINIITSFNLQFIIDNVISNNSIMNLKFIFVIMIILSTFKMINIYTRNYLINYINHELDYIMVTDIFKHILSLPYLYFKNRSNGEIISRITDLNEVRDMISNLFVTVFVDLLLVIFVFFSILSISFKLTMISFFIALLYFLIIIVFNYILKKYVSITKNDQAKVNSYLYESLSSVDTIKGLSLEENINNKFLSLYNKLLNNSFNFNKVIILEDSFKNIIDYIGIIVINYFGAILVLNNSIKLGELITFNSLIIYYLEPIKNIINLDLSLKKVKESIRRVDDLYNIEKEDLTFNEKYLNKRIKGNITANNLTYSYDGIHNILNNINFDIKKGEKVLITGNSGSGKSTLVKLILRYFNVSNEMIMIDEKDINYFNIKELRENFSYVSQNEVLYNDTLYENVTIKKYIDYDRFLKICNITKVDEIISKYPIGASFVIEENGFNLSGGEKQRIALARSLVKDSEIYIFDESLSQIDIEKERIILTNIFNEYKDKTFLIISHRLDNSDLYDKRFDLKDGVLSVS